MRWTYGQKKSILPGFSCLLFWQIFGISVQRSPLLKHQILQVICHQNCGKIHFLFLHLQIQKKLRVFPLVDSMSNMPIIKRADSFHKVYFLLFKHVLRHLFIESCVVKKIGTSLIVCISTYQDNSVQLHSYEETVSLYGIFILSSHLVRCRMNWFTKFINIHINLDKSESFFSHFYVKSPSQSLNYTRHLRDFHRSSCLRHTLQGYASKLIRRRSSAPILPHI